MHQLSCGILGHGVHSPLAPLVEDSGALGAVSFVALQLVEAVTGALLRLRVLSSDHMKTLHAALQMNLFKATLRLLYAFILSLCDTKLIENFHLFSLVAVNIASASDQ